MTSPTKSFFEGLAGRGHVSWLEHEHGRLRLEIVDEDCVQLFTVVFDDGEVKVDRVDSDADGVLRADRAWFDRSLRGEQRLLPVLLRHPVPVDVGGDRRRDAAQSFVGG